MSRLIDLQDETNCCISEVEWYATRQKDLSDTTDTGDQTWAELMLSDLEELREALAAERSALQNKGEPSA